MTPVRCARCGHIYRTNVSPSLIRMINRSTCCGGPLKRDKLADAVVAQARAGEVQAG